MNSPASDTKTSVPSESSSSELSLIKRRRGSTACLRDLDFFGASFGPERFPGTRSAKDLWVSLAGGSKRGGRSICSGGPCNVNSSSSSTIGNRISANIGSSEIWLEGQW